METDTLGTRIREQRMRLGFSQQTLAGMAGVTQGLIAQIEAGINKGSKHIIAIARALGVSPDWLEGGGYPPSGRQHPGEIRDEHWLLGRWQHASAEAREVARFVLSETHAPLPEWADKDMRQYVNGMLYAALCWLREDRQRQAPEPQKIATWSSPHSGQPATLAPPAPRVHPQPHHDSLPEGHTS